MALNADKRSCICEENYCISVPINNQPLDTDGNMFRNLNVPDNVVVFATHPTGWLGYRCVQLKWGG